VEARVSVGGGKHTFTISVDVRGHGANWSSLLAPQAVEAYSLAEALRVAGKIPLRAWLMTDEEDEECDGMTAGG
jgi:hypothetical protein